MEHIHEHLGDLSFLRGITFGVVHTGIMLIGYYTGFSINRFLKVVSKGYIAGIVGAGFAHIIADFIAAMLDKDLRSATAGIVIGGILPLLLIPFLEKYIAKNPDHIVVGDHEDVKKDLKEHHHGPKKSKK
ncbi:MAG: hypothetical protein VX198_05320 [Pseudomonadota bacterium]|nr:hypothetical protein [Pseudomonadota bacterium]MEE3261190.1 hypothetical protein [Pseudomonadota bacterium]|tara:strand:- start:224 stop:613 length:390 start_codon:yes stop_codon:yes gene_type:complete